MATESKSPRDLLNDVLELIQGDIERINDLAAKGKLEHSVTQDLCRYGSTLLEISKDQDQVRKERQKTIGQLTTEDLEKLKDELLTRSRGGAGT